MQVLQHHTDEVWHIAFSHKGERLASASKDGTAIIYKVGIFVTLEHTLQGHKDAIACMAWSPDDNLLATAGNDHTLRLWNAETGACMRELGHHSQQVSALAWLPDSELPFTFVALCRPARLHSQQTPAINGLPGISWAYFVWELDFQHQPKFVLCLHAPPVSCLAFLKV